MKAFRLFLALTGDGQFFMRLHPHWIDYSIIGLYFAFVLGIGCSRAFGAQES